MQEADCLVLDNEPVSSKTFQADFEGYEMDKATLCQLLEMEVCVDNDDLQGADEAEALVLGATFPSAPAARSRECFIPECCKETTCHRSSCRRRCCQFDCSCK